MTNQQKAVTYTVVEAKIATDKQLEFHFTTCYDA